MGTKSGHGKGCDNRTESVWNLTAKGYDVKTFQEAKRVNNSFPNSKLCIV